ncbi:ABC transporter permease [Parabacteroides pacaensis]|uniref:ABC transporter permease n=1 Tax=Parabacteroides pacaensis TaxID=2086575 RepID=UPI000D0E84EC|nr:FtsX-like permease family protein [Parabacteroides pacaensis]
MKSFIIAFRSLLKKGRSNGIKIISLGVGLAIGLVLISKVCFNRSFDTFYPDAERIYRIHENFYRANEDKSSNAYDRIPGAVAPAMKAEIPEVETATRLVRVGGDKELFFTPDKKRYSARFVMLADTNVFDVFSIPILIGNPKEILARPDHVLVSRRIAENLGGIHSALGQTFQFEFNPVKSYTIAGVYEDIPENSHLRFEIVGSIQLQSEQSRSNWLGNEVYLGYVKLYPGIAGESLHPAMRRMLERHVDMEELRKSGIEGSFILKPMLEMYSGTDVVKNMNSLLLTLAVVLLFAAMLNYILIVLSTLLNRSKEVAVHKCYGASERNLFSMILSETLLHMLLSIILAVILIWIFQAKVEELLNVTLRGLFTPDTLLVLLGVCTVLFFITALIPTYIFLRIPVAAAFRNYRESRRYWKLFLLFVQFIATAYMVSLLVTINRQYTMMVNDDPGYAYEKLLYYDASGVDPAVQKQALEEVSRLSIVDQVSSSWGLPFSGASGNNIGLPGDNRELFNVADLYFVGDHYFSLMEIPIVSGEAFRPNEPNSGKIMVSRRFVDKMEQLAGWKDGVLGKSIQVTEHSQYQDDVFTIIGIYEDFRVGTVTSNDLRASVLFCGNEFIYGTHTMPYLLIKLHQLTPDNILKVNEVLKAAMPGRNMEVVPYKASMVNLYRESRNFRDSILIGGVVTLIITLMGLMGYTTDETNRRSREIAIRKVNGATAGDILRIISRNISFIAVPALALGIIIAYFSSEEWLRQFADRISLHWFIFLAGGIGIYIIIISSVLFRAWRVANNNPANSLKSE